MIWWWLYLKLWWNFVAFFPNFVRNKTSVRSFVQSDAYGTVTWKGFTPARSKLPTLPGINFFILFFVPAMCQTIEARLLFLFLFIFDGFRYCLDFGTGLYFGAFGKKVSNGSSLLLNYVILKSSSRTKVTLWEKCQIAI